MKWDNVDSVVANLGCAVAFAVVCLCAAAAVGYKLLKWGGVVG